MQTHPLPTRPMYDFHPLPPTAISLDLGQIEQALTISRGFPDSHQRWQAYLAGLAYLGFKDWLQHNAPDLTMGNDYGTVLCESEQADPIIANLKVGPFRVCLLTSANPTADTLYAPEAILVQPESLAHLYVIVQVQEEQAQVWIQSFLRYDELSKHQLMAHLTPDAGLYELPSVWFNARTDQLLLDLQCLEPAAIPLPTQPLALPKPPVTLAHRLQPIVNVGQVWLRGALDSLAEQVGWLTLPEPSLALRSELRGPTAELDQLLGELRDRGTDILPKSQAIYQDVTLETYRLRLYAVFAPSITQTAEWRLLLILGPQPDSLLPPGARLQVSDGTEMLVDQGVEPNTALSYLFCLVVGTRDEQFWVTIRLHETVLTLPPLAFRAEPGSDPQA